MQGRTVRPCIVKVVPVYAVVAGLAEVRGNIDGIGSNGYRCREIHLLPARFGLIGEGGSRQQFTRTCPQIANMGAGVGG